MREVRTVRKTMFFKMAAENLKKNRQTCLPFILTLAGTAAIYDVMGTLTESQMVASMFGGSFMVKSFVWAGGLWAFFL